MDLLTIRAKLDAVTLERGMASHRDYLSMSQIGECQRALYDQLVASEKARPTGYVARENGDLWLSELRSDERTQDRLDNKAIAVLDFVDRRERPACLCGRCNGPDTNTPRANRIPVMDAPMRRALGRP